MKILRRDKGRTSFKSNQSKNTGFDPKTQKMELYRVFSEIPQKRNMTSSWVKEKSKEGKYRQRYVSIRTVRRIDTLGEIYVFWVTGVTILPNYEKFRPRNLERSKEKN